MIAPFTFMDDDPDAAYRRACQSAALNGQPSPLIAALKAVPDGPANNVIPWLHATNQTNH
jgi:hypothetical protein